MYLFFSYARPDYDRLLPFYSRLMASIWLDRTTGQHDEQWAHMIHDAIEKSAGAIITITNSYVQDEHLLHNEIPWILERFGNLPQLFIVRFDAVPLPESLRSQTTIDAVGRDLGEIAAELEAQLPEIRNGNHHFAVGWPRLMSFTGRDELLVDLHRLLKLREGKAGIIPANPDNADGIGKTQLAVEYAHRYRFYYPGGVYWINARASWTREIAQLAEKLPPPPVLLDTSDRDHQLTGAFRNYLLEQNANTLLILDNVENPRDVLNRDIGPKLKLINLNARLLLISRRRDLPPGFSPLEVGLLTPDEAWAILNKPDEYEEDLEAICEPLDYLPLALRLAAPLTIGELTTALKRATGSPVDKIVTWHWQHLQDKNTLELLMLAAAYESAMPVPLARLRLLSGLSDESFDKAIHYLLHAHLFDAYTQDAIWLHPLIREAARQVVPSYETHLAASAGRMVDAYRTPSTLSHNASTRGFMALVDDLRETRLALSETHPTLNRLERLFNWEIPHLQDRKEADLILHIRERAHHQGDDTLRDRCNQWLTGSTYVRVEDNWRFPLDPAPLLVLYGHSEPVLSVAVLPDGQRALSASDTPTLRLWNIETGEMLRTLEGHTGPVYSVAVLPDGYRALSASDDQTLRLWNIETGQTQRLFEGHTGPVHSVAVLPDGKHALSGAWDNTLRLWDVETGETLRILQGHSRPINSVVLLSGGQQALSASLDRTLRLWDLETGETRRILQGHSGMVLSVAVLPGDHYALSASNDGTLRLWDLETGETLRLFEGHTGSVSGVAVLPNGRQALSVAADRTLRLWDIETGISQRILRGHQGPVNAVTVLPDGHRALTASEDGTLRLWDVGLEDSGYVLQGHTWSIRSMALLPDNERVLSASADGTLRLWNLATGVFQPIPRKLTEPILSVAVLPDGQRALSALSDGALILWDIETGSILRILQGHTMGVLSLVVLAGGRRALSASYDDTLRLWDLDSGASLRILRGHQGAVNDVAAVPDGRRALSASADETLRLWSIETGETLRILKGHTGPVRSISALPNSHQALSAGYDGTLRLWDLDSGRIQRILAGHMGPVRDVEVLPDGDRALSVSTDSTLRMWDLHTGGVLCVLHIPEDPVTMTVIDNQRIVVGDRTDRIRVMRIIAPHD